MVLLDVIDHHFSLCQAISCSSCTDDLMQWLLDHFWRPQAALIAESFVCKELTAWFLSYSIDKASLDQTLSALSTCAGAEVKASYCRVSPAVFANL